MKIKISDEVKQKKQIIKLRKLFIDIQNECKEYVTNHALKKKEFKGLSDRSPSKWLYLVERGDWSMELQSKIAILKKKVARMGYSGKTIPRDFWLPTIIEHAMTVKFVIYQAKALRKLSAPQARAFAKKHNYELPNSIDSLFSRYSNGRDCRIRVKFNNKIEYYRFTDITICLCEGAIIPRLLKRKDYTLDLIPSQPELLISDVC